MVLVTDLKYYIDRNKLSKLRLMCKRVYGKNKFQNVVGCDGQEGFGKSTITAGDAYYMAYTLKRPLYLFFDIEALIQHAITHKDCIYIWDDAAFAALSMEAYNKVIIQFIKTILLARKNRHTYFINIQEIWRLKEPIVSRMIGLTHVYSPDEMSLGTYTYYKKESLLKMYDKWLRSKKKNYKGFPYIQGKFFNILYKIFDEKEYESLKDSAILTIGKDSKYNKKSEDNELRLLKKLIGTLHENCNLTQKELGKHFNVSERTIQTWKTLFIEGDDGETKPEYRGNINVCNYVMPKNLDYLLLSKDENIRKIYYENQKKSQKEVTKEMLVSNIIDNDEKKL